jgi:hypothetical protein
MTTSNAHSASSTLESKEWMLLGALQAARGLRNPAEAEASEKVWLDLGRKQGLDVEKVLQRLNRMEKKFRREHPERMLPHLREEKR